MLEDCPDPSEVTDFHFLQLRTLRIAAKEKNIPERSGNILASASKYGLLFVGVEGGFNVVKLETVLNIDEDKENRSIVQDFPHDFVPSGTPALLSVNATQTTLAVCVKCATNVVINLYSLSSYGGSGGAWQPFCANALSPTGAEVRDFVWNPAVEGWYAICFSDGSLQIHEVAGLSVKVVGTLQSAGTVAVCWSPKGKQLVAGKENGSFTQYKPNLAEVKTVPPPALEDSPLSVSSICWIANTLFAVVYVVRDTPNLFMVSTPKDSPVVYTNFYDVCLGNNSAPLQRYLLHLEPSWGILVCASLDSIEIAVLGNMPNFVQWDLREDGKALLPGKDGATHAVGLAVVYSAQKQLIISESECYPPMPVLFLLTNNGLLVSFHMVNSSPSAASLVSAPLPLEGKAAAVTQVSPLLSNQAPSTSNQAFVSSSFVKRNQGFGDQASVVVSVPQPFMSRTESLTTPYQPQQKEPLSLRGEAKKPEGPSLTQVQMTPASGHFGVSPSIPAIEKSDIPSSDSQSSYMTAIMAEIQSFVKELQELRQLQASSPAIDGEDDMVPLKSYALNLHNFQKDISDTMQSISSDIYTLKNMLLESFVLVEEAASRERRRNDHSYVTMLKERALDPVTARRMRRMGQHHQYLTTQLREVSDKLDQQWMQMRKASKGGVCISSTEAIYKTIVNHQKIIHNLRKRVELLTKKADERRLWNTTKGSRYHKRSVQEDLSKLADAFLQVRIAQHPEEGEVTTATAKKLSPESQRVLRDFLKRSSVVTVRPTAIYSPSQSRLLSNTTPSEDFLGSEHGHEKEVSPNPVSTPPGEKEITDSSEAQTPKIATKLSFSFTGTPNQPASSGPVYEAVTPPEATPAPIIKSVSGDKVSMPGSPVVTEQQVYQQPLFKPTSSGESSIKSGIDQGSSFSMMSSISSNAENSHNISFPVKGKPLTFNQTSPENVSPASTSLFFTKPLSTVSSNQKPNEIPAANLLASSNNVTSSATIFQYAGPKKDALSSVPNQTPTASSTKAGSQLVISESSKFSQPAASFSQLTTNTLNQPVSSGTAQSLPVAKTLQVSSPSLFAQPENKTSTLFAQPENKTSTLFAQPENKTSTLFAQPENKTSTLFAQSENKTSTLFAQPENKTSTLFAQPENKTSALFAQPENKTSSLFVQPENKNSTLFAMSGDKNTSVEKGSMGFFSQTLSSGVNQSTLKADAVPVSSSAKAAVEIPFPNKTDTADSQSPPDNQLKDVEKSLPALSTSASTTVTKADIPATAISQPTASDTFSSVSELKQLISTPQTTPDSEAPVVTTTVAVSDIISQPVSSASVAKPPLATSVISQPVSTTATSPVQVPAPPVTTTSLLFGQSTVVTTAVSSGTESSATESAPVFGVKAAQPLFKTTSAETPSFFGAAAGTFGQQPVVTQSSPFGQSSTFPSAPTGGGFFSQVPSFESPAAATTTSSSDFNSQTSTFSFGKPAFGQTTGSTFGLAKSFFGQNTTTPFTQAGSTASSFSFAQGSGSVFGQGSFFSGLGGKPSEENANKNVFGLSSNVKIGSDTTNLFKNSSVTSLGAVNSGGTFTGSGSFSSGTGSVAQAGFGAFQQNAQPQTGGFGSAPSFGGAPAFGSPPAFGGSPSFGAGNAFSSSVFGQQQVNSNFSNFANASSPTFGTLASQSPGGFGSSSPVSGFGGAGFGSSPVFGGSSSFGAAQPTSFGSPGSPPSNTSAFTQWRN